jgi:CubicO group peptidase (beta-lactamase class C family)
MRLSRALLTAVCSATPVLTLGAQASRLDSLDSFVKAQMAQRRIRGLSLAIIKDGRIAVARAYGVVDDISRAPVTSATLFQAGSISKPVSALGALHLVEAGKLSLDGEVNGYLTTWKVPENPFTATEKVTLRRLLSHSAGMTVHGFPGYDVSAGMPPLVQVLNGTPPANTPPIRVDTTPGAIWRYSGGGFTVMQQMMIDVTGMPFPRYMQLTVLDPIGMGSSSFEQPQPPARAALTAGGYYSDRTPVKGRWHLYPEMAAAGLWTTPTDLARFAIEIQESYAGRGHGVISPEMAKQYLTDQKGGSGLGMGVGGIGPARGFGHNGRDEGFDANLVAAVEAGDGLVIMINANDNSRMMARLQSFVFRAWGFANHPPEVPSAVTAARIDPNRLARYAGYYEAAENNMMALAPDGAGTGLQSLADGLPDEELLAIDSTTFGSNERPFRVRFSGEGATLRPGEPRERKAPRVAPLPSSLTPVADPNPALTSRVSAVLQAILKGGAAVSDASDLTPGAKKDLGGGDNSALAGMGVLTYLGQEEVSGRGIRRHGGEVSRVRMYRFPNKGQDHYLLVHLTVAGSVTDYDVVDR